MFQINLPTILVNIGYSIEQFFELLRNLKQTGVRRAFEFTSFLIIFQNKKRAENEQIVHLLPL